MRISDWSSDVCSSDRGGRCGVARQFGHGAAGGRRRRRARRWRGAGGCRRRPCAVRRGGRGMSPQIELNLGLILFLPWFLILGVLFWLFPRQQRHWRRRLFISEERRVGKEWVSTCRSRWSPEP